MTPGPVLYSVVVTAHNAAATISSCLGSLDRQAGIVREALEIIVVDDRSNDGTAAAAEASGTAGLRVMRIRRRGEEALTARQAALDAGISAARGAIVLTLDADGSAGSGWVASMAGPIEQGLADAVAGPVTFRDGRGGLAGWQTVDAAFYLAFCHMLNRFGLRSGVFFGNFAFRRSIYGEIGGFRRIGFALTEDLAFAQALQAWGGKIHYTPSAPVEVAACLDWRSFLERALRISAGGVSALSVAMGLWMASLPLLAAAALLLGGAFPLFLALRYAAGAAFVQTALSAGGGRGLQVRALIYEPVALLIGLQVALRLMFTRKVAWGGILYDR